MELKAAMICMFFTTVHQLLIAPLYFVTLLPPTMLEVPKLFSLGGPKPKLNLTKRGAQGTQTLGLCREDGTSVNVMHAIPAD